MAEPASLPISVIGPQFVAPSQLELIVDTHAPGNIVITDTDHKIFSGSTRALGVEGISPSPSDVASLPSSPPHLYWTAHRQWNVFKGESNADSDLIFTPMKKHIGWGRKLHIKVFLANNRSSKDSCDFNIKGSFSKEQTCTIHTQESSTPIAQDWAWVAKSKEAACEYWYSGGCMCCVEGGAP
ncbi:LURP1-like domain-containing protein [Artemisia annua]|uniref:LURP1-like domain-containing protein n=1 Tax=Artemisia annua TaxID=35608 RepID=A0A2U1MM11_ARTAN|nr:LURP1-like domain-containing protein [Artemisia annua]